MSGGKDGTADPRAGSAPLVTPDGHYIVVRGRLWRAADPGLAPDRRQALVDALMAARRAVGIARRQQDAAGEGAARAAVHAAKVALGERGPPWWTDGEPDLNRRLVRNTPYAAWHAAAVDARTGTRPGRAATRATDRSLAGG